MTEVIKLLAIFLTIVVGLKLSKLLPVAVGCGIVGAVLLFRLEFGEALRLTASSLTSKMTATTLLAFYSITFLQRMLEKRGHLVLAQRSLGGIFNNRRINASLAPILIGTLPSAGAVTLCGAIVEDAAGDTLTMEEKTFVTSYYRHIPESFLPTYTSILIGVELTGISLSAFLLGTFPMVLVLILLGYLFYLRKIPVETGLPPGNHRGQDVKNLCKALWTIVSIIALVLAFGTPVYIAVTAVILLSAFINKFTPGELKPMFASAFEAKLIFSTAAIMVFKDIIIATGAMNALPAVFARLPVPQFIVYFLLFFLRHFIGGAAGHQRHRAAAGLCNHAGCGNAAVCDADVLRLRGHADIPHPCVSGGGHRLFWHQPQRSCEKDAAGATAVLCDFAGVLFAAGSTALMRPAPG